MSKKLLRIPPSYSGALVHVPRQVQREVCRLARPAGRPRGSHEQTALALGVTVHWVDLLVVPPLLSLLLLPLLPLFPLLLLDATAGSTSIGSISIDSIAGVAVPARVAEASKKIEEWKRALLAR